MRTERECVIVGGGIGGEDGYPKKPDPASVIALMKREQVRPSETLLIGDSPIDVDTGRRAGIMTVCVAHGLATEEELRVARPEVLVNNFQELLALATRSKW